MKRKSFSNFRMLGVAAAIASTVLASQVESADVLQRRSRRQAPPPNGDSSPCAVQELKKSPVQGLKLWSPDGSTFLINKEDERGTAQVYISTNGGSALKCITCEERLGGPKRERFKMQPVWHPSGRWIFVAVERDKFSPPPILGWNRKYVEGQLQSGLWTNMYAISLDGAQWHRLTDFKSNVKGTPDGYTGPAFTPDGRQAVWSQIVDGNIFRYHPFGKWELTLADFQERDGKPSLSNVRDITPRDMHWNEPGSFHPDGVSLLMSGSVEKDAQGMDQYILNIRTNRLTNLTNSPTVWDEHGVFSPNGEKIMFMSAYPYRSDPKASKVMSIKTEFMLMNKDGSDLTQLTHFKERGYPEYGDGIAATQLWSPDGRSANLARLVFPKYEHWDLVFRGPCGGSAPR